MSEYTQGKDITLYLWMIKDIINHCGEAIYTQLTHLHTSLQEIANKDIPTVSASND